MWEGAVVHVNIREGHASRVGRRKTTKGIGEGGGLRLLLLGRAEERRERKREMARRCPKACCENLRFSPVFRIWERRSKREKRKEGVDLQIK